MGSFSVTGSVSFTATHAKHLATKVSADLKRMQRFYGSPTDSHIADIELEVIELLKSGYLGTLTLGFKRDGLWVEPTLRYTARNLGDMQSTDDDPGRVRPGANVSGAAFYNYLTYSGDWTSATASEKLSFNGRMPYSRADADEPVVSGYLQTDRTYSSGGRSLERSSVRSS
jgi:hypothetical protein